MRRWVVLPMVLVSLFLGPEDVLASIVAPQAVNNLTAWYDASNSATITGTTSVSQWLDGSGKGNTLSQSTGSAQPSLSTISGNQAIVFGGAQYFISSTTNTFATGSNPSSIFVVADYTGGSTDNQRVVVDYGTTAAGSDRSVRKVNGSMAAYASLSCGPDIDSASSWASTPTLVYTSFGSSATSINVNGGTFASGNCVPTTTASTSLYVGQKTALGGFYWVGPVYEIVIYNSALSTAERQFIEGYLACKWGFQANLPATHPYKSSCPSTATANMSIALAVSPSGLLSPGTVLTYTTTFTNASGTIDYNPVITGAVPAHTWFQVSSATQSLGSTGLSAAVTYSNNGGTTYTYTPASGAGGAAAGYDATVTNVRCTLSGALGPASSVNSGTTTYVVRII
jgi:uncharacterized repeat protein (TIGR01451 family)